MFLAVAYQLKKNLKFLKMLQGMSKSVILFVSLQEFVFTMAFLATPGVKMNMWYSKIQKLANNSLFFNLIGLVGVANQGALSILG